jgi:hypothetical protein
VQLCLDYSSPPLSFRCDMQVVQPRAMSFYDLSAKDIDGNDVSFDKFQGKVVLVTNVACK